MNKKEFYKTYIPALEKALDEAHVNLGFNVKCPEDFIDTKFLIEIENYIEDNEDDFLEKTAYFFDAKSHNFPSIQGIPINEYKLKILQEIDLLRSHFFDK